MNKAILDDHSIRSRGVAAYPYRRSPTQITTTNSTSVLRTRLRLKAKIIDAHSPIWAALHPPRDGTSHRPVEIPLRRNRDSKFRWRARQGSSNQIRRSEEHTSELQSLMRISYAVLCLKKKRQDNKSTFYHKTEHKNI